MFVGGGTELAPKGVPLQRKVTTDVRFTKWLVLLGDVPHSRATDFELLWEHYPAWLLSWAEWSLCQSMHNIRPAYLLSTQTVLENAIETF